MLMSSPFSWLLVAVVASLTIAAPVEQQSLSDELKAALPEQIQEQEKELESLSALEGQAPLGMEVTKSNSFSYANVNGAVKSDKTAEETVADPIRQKLISDIKEKLSSKQASPSSKQESKFKANIDIPDVGVHKELIQGGDQKPEVIDTSLAADDISEEEGHTEQELEEIQQLKNTIEFTPQLVAEYLVRTGETDEFKTLLQELVDSAEISESDAELYEKSVMDAVDELMQEESFANADTYPEDYGRQEGFQQYEQAPYVQMPQDVFSLYGMEKESERKEDEEKMNTYIEFLLNRPASLDEMIGTLLDDWLTRAIINGDPDAEEILSNIIEYVSKDDDPNDEAQVKAILGDIFAEALLEDLTPRIEPESLGNFGMNEVQQSELPASESSEDVSDVQTDVQTSSEEKTESRPESPEQLEERLKM